MKMRAGIEVLDEGLKAEAKTFGRNLKFSINLFLKPQTCGVIDIVWVEAERKGLVLGESLIKLESFL